MYLYSRIRHAFVAMSGPYPHHSFIDTTDKAMPRGGGKYFYTEKITLNTSWNPIYFTEHSSMFEKKTYVKIGVPLIVDVSKIAKF